jgi:hypothetical protein
LLADRAHRVIRIDQAGKIRGNIQPKFVFRGNTFNFFLGKINEGFEDFQVVDAVAELPAPIIPFFIRDICPDRSPGRGPPCPGFGYVNENF